MPLGASSYWNRQSRKANVAYDELAPEQQKKINPINALRQGPDTLQKRQEEEHVGIKVQEGARVERDLKDHELYRKTFELSALSKKRAQLTREIDDALAVVALHGTVISDQLKAKISLLETLLKAIEDLEVEIEAFRESYTR